MSEFKPNPRTIAEIYGYLTKPADTLPDHADISFVFGRKSRHLAEAASAAAARSELTIVSGNVGKDSGDLPTFPPQGMSEAVYLLKKIRALGNTGSRVWLEQQATKGVENAQKGITKIQQFAGMAAVGTLVVVSHAPQLRRLGATFSRQAREAGLEIDQLVHYPSAYPFNPEDRFDQYEAASEITRLVDFSTDDIPWLDRPNDIPSDLLEYGREVVAYYEQQFAAEGIINPSTADDTDRTRLYTAR